ncbi:MAG: response regulator transcription factor [Chloroflexi bacterium]|nr:response regulator transcription factor [Chloroflexota bacterium]
MTTPGNTNAVVPIRVLVAEDHTLVREGTMRILENCPDITVVGEAADGVTAVAQAVALAPDVAILDIRMPGLNGVQATREIKERNPGTAVLIVSAFDDDDYVRALFDAGAAGYMLKTIGAEELVDAIRRVHAGETVIHPLIARKVARLLVRPARADESTVHLTEKELEVLQGVCRGLRNKEIAVRMGVSVRTVEGHLETIFGRLGLRSRTEAAMYAASHGWFVEGEG